MPQYYRILDNGQGFNKAESKRQQAKRPKAKKQGSSAQDMAARRQRSASKKASGVVNAKGRGGVDGSYVGYTQFMSKERQRAQGKKK